MLYKLAFRNARRSLSDYAVYLITVTLSFSLMFAFGLVTSSDAIAGLSEGMDTFRMILDFINVIILFVLCFLINYTTKPTRRVDLLFSVAYENDFETAKAIILECVKGLDYALEDPAPFVGVEAHAASSVDIAVKFWVPTDKYYDAKYAMREAVKLAFDANGIEIPYPQLQIHTAADKESKTETKKK